MGPPQGPPLGLPQGPPLDAPQGPRALALGPWPQGPGPRALALGPWALAGRLAGRIFSSKIVRNGPPGPWGPIFRYFCPIFGALGGPWGTPGGALGPPIFSLSWAAVAADNSCDEACPGHLCRAVRMATCSKRPSPYSNILICSPWCWQSLAVQAFETPRRGCCQQQQQPKNKENRAPGALWCAPALRRPAPLPPPGGPTNSANI